MERSSPTVSLEAWIYGRVKERRSGRCDTCSDLVDFRVNPVWSNADIFFDLPIYGIQIQVHFHVGHFLAKGNQLLVPINLLPWYSWGKNIFYTDVFLVLSWGLLGITSIWSIQECEPRGGGLLLAVQSQLNAGSQLQAGGRRAQGWGGWVEPTLKLANGFGINSVRV